MILNENNAKAHLPLQTKYLQLLLLNSNRKLAFYNFFKKDTKKSCFLDAIKNPLQRTAINKLIFPREIMNSALKQGDTLLPRHPKV